VKTKIFRSLMIVVASAVIAGAACADSIELKTGQIIQGKFLGGSSMNIRFRVNGQEQVFATKDVLNISFSDTSVQGSDNAAPSPAPAPTSTDSAPSAEAAPYVPPDENAAEPNPTAQASAQPDSGQGITIPADTSLLVRMIDSVDSSKNKIGDIFHASLESPLVVGDTVVAPKGADVYGKLAQAKESGKISGGAELTLELTGVRINGNIVPVDSTTYDVAGKGRGKQSAGRIGGGAALGAIIGGVVGGGAGAAIGAGIGAGAGTAVHLSTHGEEIRIPSETLLEFKFEQPLTVPSPSPSN
jgi:hypothetical protein